MNNTGNPVEPNGSSDPKDLQDNAQVFDQLINGEAAKVTSRTGDELKSWAGLTADIDKIVSSLDTSNFTFSSVALGTAGTSNGQYFRVIQNPDTGISFIYYRNDNGSATRITDTPSSVALSSLSSKATLADLSVAVHDVGIFSGDYKNLTSPAQGSKRVRFRINPCYPAANVTTQFVNPVIYSGSTAVRSAFLPPDVWIDGDNITTRRILAYPKDLIIKSFSPGSSSAVIEYTFGRTDNTGSAAGVLNAHDTSGAFYPASFDAISSAGKNAVAAYPGGRLSFLVMNSDVTAAGFNPATQAGVDSFVRLKLNSLPVILNAAITAVTYNVRGLGDFVCPSGVLSAVLNGYSSGNLGLDVFVKNPSRKSEVSGYTRYTADFNNSSSFDYDDSWPMEIKVSFKPGEAPCESCLALSDSSGNVFDVQFLPAGYTNPRSKSSMGYWPDGSLRTGSLLFYAPILSGGKLFVELKIFSQPVKKSTPLASISYPLDSGPLTVSIGGYTWNFLLTNAWGLSSITDPSGVNSVVQHGFYAAGKVENSNNLAEFQSMVSPSIRVLQNGPVFTEVEVSVYNTANYGVPAGVINHKARYILMKKGRTRILCQDMMAQDVNTSVLAGVLSRVNLTPGSASSLLADNVAKGASWENSASGKKWSVIAKRAVGDLHRDGVSWGPTRPTLVRVLSVNGTTMRVYAGWELSSAADESFSKWGFEKDWAWTSEIWVNPEAYSSLTAPLTSQLFNSPSSFAGQSGYPQAMRRSLTRKIEDFLEGSMDYWYSGDAASWRGGDGTTRQFRLASLTYDLYRFKKQRIGSFQDVYNRFVTYCDNYWGGFSTPGDSYTTGKLVMQYASRTVIPVYQWMYIIAIEEGNSAAVTALKAAMKNYADAMVTQYNKGGGINLTGTVSGVGNSNANATGFRVLAIAIYMGLDTDGTYLSILQAVESNLTKSGSGGFMNVENIVSDGAGEAPASNQWLHYQAYVWNNYAMGCDLIKRKKAFDLNNYLISCSNAEGGFYDVDHCTSESRRGSFNTYTFALFNLMFDNRASTLNCARSIVEILTNQYGAEPGSPARAFGFSGYQNGSNVERTDVSFCGTTLADLWFYGYLNSKTPS